MVDLVGIEPTTSSMPWKRAPKLRHRPTRCVNATSLLSPLRLDFVKLSRQACRQLENQPPVEPSIVTDCSRNLAGDKKYLRDREHWRLFRCLRQ